MIARTASFCAIIVVAAAATPGFAANGRAVAFTGAYAGPELGAHEHHFYLRETNLATGAQRGRYYRAWGVGGGAFAGYQFPVGRRVRIGAEVGWGIGGDAPVAHFSGGTRYARHPQWGVRGTGRLGYMLTERLLGYGTFGYGGYRYRDDNSAGVTNAQAWASSFTVGAGAEYRLSTRLGIRLDFRHLDNSMSQILVGIPIQF
ncbi:outer membrane protein [Sphingomonas crusticola]|uniref:outer membrane protein n=1 Tax=Sphingomonas crusticola TaxID=1697973 RepID=UPI0013C33A00|nr:outer membrane beta-barrel protein [Sphingomonas crusticola]